MKVKKKAGIYLCIKIEKKIAFLFVWPGNLTYQYSRIDEPNDNLLLTLIRYGFSLSCNSIICLNKIEIENFDFNGYEIFEEKGECGYDIERNKIVINIIKEKSFELGKKDILNEGLKELNIKKIINIKINQNCLLLYEEKDDTINSIEKKTEFLEFIKKENIKDIYFENVFEIDIYHYLIKENSCYLSEKGNNCLYYTEQSIKDLIYEKICKKIDILFKKIYKELFNENNLSNLNKEFIFKFLFKLLKMTK